MHKRSGAKRLGDELVDEAYRIRDAYFAERHTPAGAGRQLRTRVMGAKDKLAEAYLALQKHDHQGAAKLLELTREQCFVLIADIEHEAERHEQAVP